MPFLLLTAWLDIRELNSTPFWGDERWSVFDTGGVFGPPHTPVEVWQVVEATHPRNLPGYQIAVALWGSLTGFTPAALRLFSLLIGLLGVAWTYRLGRDLHSPLVGVMGAAVLSGSILFLHYSIKVRMYIPLVPLTAYITWVYLRIVRLRREPRAGDWFGLWASAVLLMYTHYMSLVPLLAIGAYHLLFAPKNRRWWIVVGVLALAGLAFVPWLTPLMNGVAEEAETTHFPLTALETLARMAYLLGNGSLLVGLIVLVLAAVGSLWNGLRERGVKTLWFFTALSVALVVLTNELLKILRWERVRYLIGLWPLLALVAGLGLALLWRRGRIGQAAAGALLAALLALGILNHQEKLLNQELDTFQFLFPVHLVEAEIGALAQPDDLIVMYLPDGLRRDDHAAAQHLAKLEEEENRSQYFVTTTEFFPGQAPDDERARESAIQGRQHVWLSYVVNRSSATMGDYMSLLSDEFTQCPSQHERDGLRVEQYTLSPVCCLSETMGGSLVRFDNGVELVNAAMGEPANNAMDVTVLWSIPADLPPHEVSATFQLLDANGNKLAQADDGLVPQPYSCQTAHISLDGVPAGRYTVDVGIYRWETGERIAGSLLPNGGQEYLLPIGSVTLSDSAVEQEITQTEAVHP